MACNNDVTVSDFVGLRHLSDSCQNFVFVNGLCTIRTGNNEVRIQSLSFPDHIVVLFSIILELFFCK